jgi:hypothetical protein
LKLKLDEFEEPKNPVNNFSFNKRDAQSVNESADQEFTPIAAKAHISG